MTDRHEFKDTNRHVVEVPDTFAIARWRRDDNAATIARCILGTLKYEPHGTDTTALRRALEAVIEREGAPSTIIAAPVSDEEEAFWREMARMPDLQKLVERAGRRHAASIGAAYDPNPATRPKHQGGHKHGTPEEWAKWDAANAEFQANRQWRAHDDQTQRKAISRIRLHAPARHRARSWPHSRRPLDCRHPTD